MTPGPKNRDRRKEGRTKRWRQFDGDKTLPAEEAAEESSTGLSSQKTNCPSIAKADATEDPPHEENSRRELPSNWGRYEELEDDGLHLNRKGAQEFELLLSSAAGSEAHFRFKEEQDWQEDFQVDESISLDCELLADALRTVPVPERLGLPEDIFPPEIYKQYMDDATSFRNKYVSTQSQRKLDTAGVGDLPIKSVKTAARLRESEFKANADGLANSLAACFAFKGANKGSANRSPVSDSAQDELGFLLSLSKKDEEVKVQKAERVEPQPKVQGVPERGDEAQPSPKPKEPLVNLEDWLDSVLDD